MNRKLLALAVSAVLSASHVTPGLAADAAVATPASAQTSTDDGVLKRAHDAVVQFETAYLTHDSSGLGAVVTADVVAEYALAAPGEYLSLDSSALAKRIASSSDPVGQISNLMVYPTAKPDTVFVRYYAETHSASSVATTTLHQALVELRGDRISRIREFETLSNESAKLAKDSAPITTR